MHPASAADMAASSWFHRRDMWSDAPPEPRTRLDNNPTLLYSWWCTCFSIVIILVRVCGRKVRSNMLFREDWIMLAAIVPLLLRMGLAHVVLLFGTNNVATEGVDYTPEQLYHRSIGSRAVLAARVMYAATIWMAKLTVSEFLKRITIRIWKRSYELVLRGIRIFLIVTFIAVVIATLAECQPFDHYWQVIPDPGPKCRQGYAQLLVMGVCDIISDCALIAFPIPIILVSGQNWKRKLQLLALFSLSIIMIAVTATRVPQVIMHLGRQQYRTVWASSEILASIAVSNAVILGSFVRDKGTKKNKYRQYSESDSIEKGNSIRRPTLNTIYTMDSDEDLFRSLGCRMPEHLQVPDDDEPRQAQPVSQSLLNVRSAVPEHIEMEEQLPRSSDDTDRSLYRPPTTTAHPLSSPQSRGTNGVGFFDVGGLLEDGSMVGDAQISRTQTKDGVTSTDFAPPTPPEPVNSSRRPSHAFMQDIGILPSPTISRSSHSSNSRPTLQNGSSNTSSVHHQPPAPPPYPPTGVVGPILSPGTTSESQHTLQDPGGLLTPTQSNSTTTTSSSTVTAGSWQMQIPSGVQRPPEPLQRQNTQASLGLQDLGGLLMSRTRTMRHHEEEEDLGPRNEGK